MFGIMTQDGRLVLCRASYQESFVLSRWNHTNIPVMIKDSFEVDKLLQEYTIHLGNYTLKVFEYTAEQEERLLIRRLKGY